MNIEKNKSEILALIPARGGSKGIYRKNLLKIAGKPLIAYSIEQAKSSNCITRVIVSTDDDEIAEVAKQWGAEVPFMRPAEFAQDLSPDIDVFRHALQWLSSNEGYSCQLIVHLRPTGPVRKVALIDQAIETILAHPEADSLRSVSWPDQTPYKMWRIERGYLKPLLMVEGLVEPYCLPRQILPEVFWQNGYIDIIRSRTILEMEMMGGGKILPFMISEPILEIDYPEIIPLVEDALIKLQKGQWPEKRPSTKRYPV